ncbi:MAG: hypothetical protein JNM36_16320 [Chitinophagales bacterium]|nr:hypothetical protein [Chitinophagales bacterium]
MKNSLIVESKNDKFFVQAVIKHLEITNTEYVNICDENYELLNGLSHDRLVTVLDTIKNKAKKENIERIGIIIDQDKADNNRIDFVNNAIKEVFGVPQLFTKTGEFKTAPIDSRQTIDIATYFTNVNNEGELETLLKQIKKGDSVYADKLACWQDCLRMERKELKKKDFDKLWVQLYIRYDQCSKKEQKQADGKCNFETSLLQKDIWDFEHECLSNLKNFLCLFK